MNVEFDRHGLVAKASAFAAYAHDGQFRKGSAIPYIVHPMEAMAIAASMTNDPEVLAAAALHDVIEDCGVTEEEIRLRFGKRVAQLVASVSERKEADAVSSWQRRKLLTINRLRVASREKMILTLADKLSNLRSIERDFAAVGNALWQRFNQPNPSMHHWYYASIAESLKALEDTAAYREYAALIGRVFGK
jgi:myo-inositol-1(or 4)-monophosphatase